MTSHLVARRRRAVQRELPDAIELIVLAVRAGHLPFAAVRQALPFMGHTVRPAFERVVERVVHGERFAEALPLLGESLGPAASPLAHQLAAAERDGLPLAPVLDRLAADARSQRRRDLEARARQLPVRMAVPLTLCTLPAFVLMALAPLLMSALASLEL